MTQGSLLDSILDSSPRIIAQEHDLAKIGGTTEADISAAISRLSGGRAWDAREYGLTAEQAAAEIRAAATPERRAKVIADLQARAIRRAGLDTSNGRVNAAFAGRPAWHGLGVTVDRAMTSIQALDYAGLSWKVSKQPLSYYWGGERREVDDQYAVVREDTGAHLGVVGSRYAVAQNSECFDFLDGALRDVGATYESAGSIYGGKRVWMLANLPKQRFEVQPGDVQESYVLFANCHDGSGAAWCFPTSVRVECANTMRLAQAGRRGGGLWIRHTGKITAKIKAAQSALGLAVKTVDQYHDKACAMVRARVEPKTFVHNVLDEVLDVSFAQAASGADLLAAALTDATEREDARIEWARKIEARNDLLEDILNRYDSSRCAPAGSVWAAFNAVTESADHRKPNREAKDADVRRSRRFESILTGPADQLKQVAYAQAVAAL